MWIRSEDGLLYNTNNAHAIEVSTVMKEGDTDTIYHAVVISYSTGTDIRLTRGRSPDETRHILEHIYINIRRQAMTLDLKDYLRGSPSDVE
jgi:hypothetical protein